MKIRVISRIFFFVSLLWPIFPVFSNPIDAILSHAAQIVGDELFSIPPSSLDTLFTDSPTFTPETTPFYGDSLPLGLEKVLKRVSAASVPWRRPMVSHSPSDEVIGQSPLYYGIQGEDTLVELARHFGLGYNQMILANPKVDPWLPTPGTRIQLSFRHILPVSLADIVVNIDEMRLYHLRGDGWVDTYPIGVGREGFATPVGQATVIHKTVNPVWNVPLSIRKENPKLPAVVASGPENPLGTHAIYLSLKGYLVHGTNEPYGIGRRVSHGCIRLYPEDVGHFFSHVSVGDSVELVSQPVKAGWLGERLFLEIHPPLKSVKSDFLDTTVTKVLTEALQTRKGVSVVLDWRRVNRMVKQANGMAEVVGQVNRTVDSLTLPLDSNPLKP